MSLQDELDAKTTKDLADITARLDALARPQQNIASPTSPIIPAFAGSNAGPVMLTQNDVVKPVQIQQAPPVSQAQVQKDAQNDPTNLASIGKKVDPTQQTNQPQQKSSTLAQTDANNGQIDVMGAISKQLQDQIAPKTTADGTVASDLAGFKNDLNSLKSGVNALFGKTTADTASTNQAVSQSSKSSGGSNIIGDIVDVAASIIGWIICTELMKQNRMPYRWWIVGAKVFAAYPEEVKQGYYFWAIPSVRHLRAHPFSLYSRFLCLIFNWRAENIACAGGVKGAKKNWKGAAVTAILWPICYVIGFCLVRANLRQHWQSVYNLESK